jgi:hypothetical protein
MYKGNIIGNPDDNVDGYDSDATVIEVERSHSPGPSVQIDMKHGPNGEIIPKKITFREEEFESTLPHPAFKTPEVPRHAIKVSDRYQLLEPNVNNFNFEPPLIIYDF